MQLIRCKVAVPAVSPMNPSMINIELPDGTIRQAYYTTPFNSSAPGKGGFTAYPSPDDPILVARDVDMGGGSENTYYYISTIIGPMMQGETAIPNIPKGSPNFMTGNVNRETVGIKGHDGQGIEFVSENSEGGDPGVSRMKHLKVYAGGMGLKMSNLPLDEYISLTNEVETSKGHAGAKIKLSGPKNEEFPYGPDAVYIKAGGLCQIESYESMILGITQSKGKTVDIVNLGRQDDGGTGFTLADKLMGDINMVSYHNSVNIQAQGFLPAPAIPPKVMINTNTFHKDGTVQLKSGGNVEIVADSTLGTVGIGPGGNIEIRATGDINIVSDTGDVNILSRTGNVNLQPLNPLPFVATQPNKGPL